MMKLIKIFLIIYFCIVGSSSVVLGQSALYQGDLKPKLDYLSKLLQEDPEEFVKEANLIRGQGIKDASSAVDFYSLLSEYYYARGKFDSMSWSLNKAKSFVKDDKSSNLISIYLQLATSFYFSGNTDSVKYYQNIVSDFIDEQSPFYPQFLLVEGMKYQRAANYVKSIEVIIEAAKILESQNNQAKLAIAYNNLAINYEKLQLIDLQLEYLLKAQEINSLLEIPYHLAINYNNLGVFFKNQNDLEKAVYYYELSYDNLKKVKSTFLLAQNMTNRANIHEKMGEYEIAEQLFLECERLCEENQIHYGLMASAINLGNLYRIKKRYIESEVQLNRALELSRVLKTKKEEGAVLQRLFWLERDRGEYAKALDFQTRYHALNDSIINEKVKIEANELRDMYEMEKKENAIIILSNQKLYQQYVIALMALGLFVLLIILILWNNKRKLAEKELQKEALQRSHMKTLLQNKDREFKGLAGQFLDIKAQLDEATIKISSIMNTDAQDHHKFKKIDEILNKKPFESIKNNLDTQISSQNTEFFNRLLNKFPDLSPAELNLCAYLRLNMSTKDIAELLNRSVRTIETTRANIRRKMTLESQDNLVSFLMGFVDSN
ncbi:LuxR C-terminal-related transcriptional regulator [Belliella aquatica]|nr:tetratricopeptide repeat protein [Belliella aquatica]MCH7407679.1 tetratricopeptide repeat protein [Belliella aquatica]